MTTAIPSRTPTQMLDDETVLTMTQLAWVTGELFVKGASKGAPDRRKACELVESGAIRLVDPAQPVHRWKVWNAEVRRYLSEGPRRGADVVPIRAAS